MREKFHYVDNTNGPTLRSGLNKKLFIPRTHHNSIGYSGPKLWNELELNIREAKTPQKFKQLYIEAKVS